MKLNQILPVYLLTEDKISYLAQNMGDKVLSAYKQDDIAYKNNPKLSPEDVLKQLQKADVGNKYLQWITGQYIKRSFRLEDISRVHNTVKQFHNNKNQLDKKDINQYTLHELEDVIDKKPETHTSKRQQKQQIKTEGADIVMRGEDGIVIKLKTKEAACYYGKGTKWCTAADSGNMFDMYNKDGPLYVFMGNDGRKFQLHFETGQFMDERDRSIDVSGIRKKYSTLNHFFIKMGKEVAHDPHTAVRFAILTKERFPEGEKAIASDPEAIFDYAAKVIKGRFPEGEKVIASHPYHAVRYARFIIDGRFPEAERTIATSDPINACFYAKYVINGRFPEAEKAIASLSGPSYEYALHAIKGRFPEGEKVIASNPNVAFHYAMDVIKGRFPEAEKAIASDPQAAYNYATKVIKGRFPEGEKAIASDPSIKLYYAKNFL